MPLKRSTLVCLLAVAANMLWIRAQVDQTLAQKYFREAAALCEQEGGKLWGISLCGPMIFADARTGTIAANQPVPETPRPRALGFANTALDWDGTRWSTYVWGFIPSGPENEYVRARLMMHELFHRVQPQLGLLIPRSPGENDHLDTAEGRYWMQLEWQALARALAVFEALDHFQVFQKEAVQDALGFREARRRRFPQGVEPERISEINEGLPQYSGTIVAAGSLRRAAADTIQQLKAAPEKESFVRTFSYASGAAYGILLDLWAPGWARRIRVTDDLGQLVGEAMNVQPAADLTSTAERYGASELMRAEQEREKEHLARVAEYRRRFVQEPQLRMPRGRGATFVTDGITPVPEAGTIYPRFRVSGPWGSLEADLVLMSLDGTSYSLPAPTSVEGPVIDGPGWKLTLDSNWEVQPGSRPGDFQLVQKNP